MGKILKLQGVTLTDLTAPKIIEIDPIESDGSLLLFDPSVSQGQFTGLPAIGETVPNVLAAKAKGLIGGGSEYPFVVTRKTVSADIQFERTSLGGVYGLITQAGGQAAEAAYSLRASSAIRDYILANPDNLFYTSIWTSVVRVGISNAAVQSPFHAAFSTGDYLFYYQGGDASAPDQGYRVNKRSTGAGNDHTASAVPYNRCSSNAMLGAGTGATWKSGNLEFGVGTFGPWNSFNYNKAPSRIIYRVYMEDLTVSGRTPAQVRAIDEALYDEAFAIGGKFYGDTYTDPATLA